MRSGIGADQSSRFPARRIGAPHRRKVRKAKLPTTGRPIPIVGRRAPNEHRTDAGGRYQGFLNGGGAWAKSRTSPKHQDAFAGRADDMPQSRRRANRTNTSATSTTQKDDILAARRQLEQPSSGRSPRKKPVVERHSRRFRTARSSPTTSAKPLPTALTQLGKFSALAADSIKPATKTALSRSSRRGSWVKSLADGRSRI